MKRTLTLREESMLDNGVLGLVWIIMGFIQIFKNSKILLIVVSIITLVGSILILIPHCIKSEPEDEMAKYNKNRSKSTVYRILIFGILICTLLAILKGQWVINLRIILPFLLGGSKLLEFILFTVYEKVGG